MTLAPHQLFSPSGIPLFYVGPSADSGPLPALLYFSISGADSLALPPYNSPAALLQAEGMRIFSWDLPGHGQGLDKFKAMQYWADKLDESETILSDFLEKVLNDIDWLIDKKILQADRIAACGLSRGGLIATHLAAQHKNIQTILGFAPVTRLDTVKEFQDRLSSLEFRHRIDHWDLELLAERLLHLKHLRFYIGNRDEIVGTDVCYQCVRHFVEVAHERRARDFEIELRITPSIGYKGHGTAPSTFEEGSAWLRKLLLDES